VLVYVEMAFRGVITAANIILEILGLKNTRNVLLDTGFMNG
jgi:hypothetical protein